MGEVSEKKRQVRCNGETLLLVWLESNHRCRCHQYDYIHKVGSFKNKKISPEQISVVLKMADTILAFIWETLQVGSFEYKAWKPLEKTGLSYTVSAWIICAVALPQKELTLTSLFNLSKGQKWYWRWHRDCPRDLLSQVLFEIVMDDPSFCVFITSRFTLKAVGEHQIGQGERHEWEQTRMPSSTWAIVISLDGLERPRHFPGNQKGIGRAISILM